MPQIVSRIRTARRSNSVTINLSKRRAWFADEGGERPDDPQEDPKKDEPKTLEDWQKLAVAREKRLRETEEKNKRLSDEKRVADERIKAIEAAQREKLEKDGDYKSIAEQRAADIEKYKPLADRAAALETVIRESNEARIKDVPDAMKALIPLDYPPEKLQAWLNANASLLVKQPAPDFDAGAGAGGKGGAGRNEPKVTDDDRRQAAIAQANGHNVKPEDIAKRRADKTKAANGNQ